MILLFTPLHLSTDKVPGSARLAPKPPTSGVCLPAVSVCFTGLLDVAGALVNCGQVSRTVWFRQGAREEASPGIG